MSVFINGWTKEKMIKHIETHFKGKAVERDTGYCQYLTDDGKKCAVGLFLPKDDHQKFKGGVSFLLGAYENLKQYMPMTLDKLNELQ